MIVTRPSFPKATTPETPAQKRARYEAWIIETHDAQLDAARERVLNPHIIDPEYRAVMNQPNHDALISRPSSAYAIAARCWQCVCGDDPEADELQGWSRVTNCTTSKCPLHSVRPYQEKEAKTPRLKRRDASFEGVSVYDHEAKALANPGNRGLAVKGYCHQCCGGSSGVGVMGEVDACTVGNCAIWVIRPLLKKRQEENVDS